LNKQREEIKNIAGLQVRKREGIYYIDSLGRESRAVEKYVIEIYCNFIMMRKERRKVQIKLICMCRKATTTKPKSKKNANVKPGKIGGVINFKLNNTY